ncbi:hypothetical protein PAE9249_02125 [Paenibacillus sp. CECT 9249]|uniref:hypothetical protein n=1 Tax=Paenibacillus sp. CECT 9249 TaxID=2845385 RepID=UPI001E287EBD|nr:hypothetical protein [Paenibacillus sp. CECT 9249]CAH0119620.1 hypothetical protein PAE9249_02125 [Paenibacillus sp. CECT 9249]
MEKILDWIISNPYLFVVLIGALLASLSKSNKSRKPTNRMPTFGGDNGRMQEPDRSDDAGPGGESAFPDRWEREPEVRQQSVFRDERPRDLETERPSILSQPVRTSGPIAALSDHEATSGSVRPSDIAPSSEELAKGVIWAEILGPPRAKRPFNARRK